MWAIRAIQYKYKHFIRRNKNRRKAAPLLKNFALMQAASPPSSASDEKVRLGGDHRNNKEIDRICNDFSGWSRLASRHCATFSSIAFLMIFHFCQITSPAALGRLGPCKSLRTTVSHRARPSHLAETRHQSSFSNIFAALIDIFSVPKRCLPLNLSS